MRARWLATLIAMACCVGCADTLVQATGASDHASLFDDVWHEFDLHYSFFELKHVNWDSLGARYRPLALAAGTDHDFANVVAGMLAQLQDVHVSLTPGSTSSTMRYLSRCDTIKTYFDAHLIFSRYIPASQTSPSGHLRYGMLAPAVGYVYIRDFEDSNWDGEMDDALAALPGATSIVLDVRNNPGGSTALAAAIAGRFADQKRTFGFVRRRSGPAHTDFTDFVAETVEPTGRAPFSGAVYVVSNRRDFSSAEDFILALRSVPAVTIVGDTTAGASGGPIVREMANGWTYQLSEWIEYTPEHHTFEGIGLAPSVVIMPSAADVTQGIDSVLEHVLSLAQLKASNLRP
jgi:hypothetical protein